MSKSKNLDGNDLSREGRASWRCFENGGPLWRVLKIQPGGIHVLNKAKAFGDLYEDDFRKTRI